MPRILIPFIILILLDAYAFKGVSLLSQSINKPWDLIIKITFWLISLIILFQLYRLFSDWNNINLTKPEYVRTWLAIFSILFFSKLGFIFFHFIGDISWLVQKGISFFRTQSNPIEGEPMTRGTFITQVGLVASGLLFGAYTYGVLKGRYSFRVLKESIQFPNLPQVFHGLKIVQISDLHLGSFVKDFKEVEKGFEMINQLEPDLILFTGDLVNVHADEAEPWIESVKKLKSKYGKYSIFGNHDYCDYGSYSEEEKKKSIQRLKEIHKEMDFTLLEDEHQFLEIAEHKIAILGMHNWGKGFHQYGDLEKTMDGLDNGLFKILLSHDPTLWEEKVKEKKDIDLTLSGHTHGMQMGVEIPKWGIKFSPAKLRYNRWAGLYKSNNNYLYINRGFGFLGFPGRVGIHPEITLLELEQS